MKTSMTDCGAVIKASIINIGTTSAIKGGYIQDWPRTKYKIALRTDGDGWEALYD